MMIVWLLSERSMHHEMEARIGKELVDAIYQETGFEEGGK